MCYCYCVFDLVVEIVEVLCGGVVYMFGGEFCDCGVVLLE